ncbi:hypothetical protein AQS8620_03054 [Aquimixticola soesokkakensis]|uniref:Uncharacterized protein n=1 Tax=Aquimixticola soesokkakensis TaxID=1519096 RepID=A0A1Y5TJX3_9RHOB|nr:hypothetical protein [Aquimixticola soesokkakensis]SLN65834.1 hypothetical protein AQS8620_03054 [Aquimixticola soesokkakensis]
MKHAGTLLLAMMALMQIGFRLWGYDAMYLLGYGAISLMALMISATFLWLWHVRATPLALGMSMSWAGSGLIMGWWWMMKLAGYPDWGAQAGGLFVIMALLASGAVLHFAVIQSSFGFRGGSFLVPVSTALGLSLLVLFLR